GQPVSVAGPLRVAAVRGPRPRRLGGEERRGHKKHKKARKEKADASPGRQGASRRPPAELTVSTHGVSHRVPCSLLWCCFFVPFCVFRGSLSSTPPWASSRQSPRGAGNWPR